MNRIYGIYCQLFEYHAEVDARHTYEFSVFFYYFSTHKIEEIGNLNTGTCLTRTPHIHKRHICRKT